MGLFWRTGFSYSGFCGIRILPFSFNLVLPTAWQRSGFSTDALAADVLSVGVLVDFFLLSAALDAAATGTADTGRLRTVTAAALTNSAVVCLIALSAIAAVYHPLENSAWFYLLSRLGLKPMELLVVPDGQPILL